MRVAPLIFGLSLVCGFASAGCLFAGDCGDGSQFVYDLRDGSYSGTPPRNLPVGPPQIGDYAVDGAVHIEVDPLAETVVVSFVSAGETVVLRYDVLSTESPVFL